MSNIQIQNLELSKIKPYANNARVHDDKHIKQISESIKKFKFTNPIIVDENFEILCGHGRYESAKHLEMETVPAVVIDYLSENEKRAYRLADNKLTINGQWDEDLLGIELKELSELELDFDITLTGFETSEIDILVKSLEEVEEEKQEHTPYVDPKEVISKAGDIWQLGKHFIICGDSTNVDTYKNLLKDKKAQMVFTDAPYNVPIDKHVCGTGKIKHKEFAMASGEMSQDEFIAFLTSVFDNLIEFSKSGALHYLCMDWRHIKEMTESTKNYSEFKNLCVWNKSSAGMGSLDRSKHELVFVYKNGKSSHINNVELGKNGRYRTNVWDYAGVNSFGENKDDLKLHPTVKPVEMVADAILDSTKQKDIVFDAFLGSGSTLIACEKTNRTCYGIEIEPLYIDTIIKRWEEFTDKKAIHVESGKTYSELKKEILNHE